MSTDAQGPTGQAAGHGVVVIGSINADLVARVQRHPQPGETIHGTGGQILPGGKGANQAVAAAKLGAEVLMVGAVGDDLYAQAAMTGLRASGADLSGVATVDGPTGLALVTVDADGENSIVVIAGANDAVDPERIRSQADRIGNAAVVVAQGEIPPAAIEAIAPLVHGRFVHNPAPVLPLAPEAFRAADPLVVNEHEGALVLAELARAGAADQPAADAAPGAVLQALADSGIASVVLTLGARGALVLEGGEITEIPAARIRAVDTTGAGDAFIGALAARLAEGVSLPEAARFASRVGAFAATGEGAQPSYPGTADELPELSGAAS